MINRLYPRLAWQNIQKNRRFYFPYVLTIIGASGAFYIMMSLAGAGDLPERIRYAYLRTFVSLGAVVIGIFSVIFLFYTNSFLMKQRKKELGLYNVLGMGKRHIAKVLAWETMYTALFGIIGGCALGMLLQKLMTAMLLRLMRYDVYYGFYVSWTGIGLTFCLYGAILLVTLLFNLGRIHMQNPVDLIREGAAGEREPKSHWIFAVVGLAALGGGYYIAMTAQNAMEAIALYFVAVVLVIIGTYCLFTSVSIAVLKLLRKKKNLYYTARYFIGISGMLYRMKRNAVGLANICILSTMVLVMVSGTLSLFIGTEDALDARYPADLVAEVRYDPMLEEAFMPEAFLQKLTEGVKAEGRTLEKVDTLTILKIPVEGAAGSFTALPYQSGSNAADMIVMTAQDFAELTDTMPVELAEDEVLFYDDDKKTGGEVVVDFSAPAHSGEAKRVYRVAQPLYSAPSIGTAYVSLSEGYYMVVEDEAALKRLYSDWTEICGDDIGTLTWRALIDTDGSDEEKISCAQIVSDLEHIGADTEAVGQWQYYSVASRAANAGDFYSLNGGFFFLGIFLGFLFIMATVLIIYYKQITEGYEDRQRFQIMRKVGLDKSQIRSSIDMQILAVFFAPLFVAAVHVAFDFRLVRMLLTLFGLTNVSLTLLCTAGTLLAFMAVYGFIYKLTAKAYYRIVS